MTEALKTDWLEQAKREITKEFWQFAKLRPELRSYEDIYREMLVAERARNLELRERVRNEALEEAAQLLEEMRKFPVEPCSHDMEGDESICDGCHFAWEKKQATVAEAIRAKKHRED